MIDKQHVRKKPLALVVDDDFSIRITMNAALAKVGFDVLEAENGRLALSFFKSEKPDIILLDVVMPEMDGFETCVAIRNLPEGGYPQILMVTGLDDVESIARAFEAGANDFISKPINWLMLGYRGQYMLRAGRAFQELHMAKNKLIKTQALAKLGTWEINLTNNEFSCSLEACSILGLNALKTPVAYNDFFTPIMAHEQDMVKHTIDNAIQLKTNFSLNYQIVYSNNTKAHILNQNEIIFDENGQPKIMLGVVQDVSQLKRAEERIHILAFHDGLTGLANRMFFLEQLDVQIQKASRNKQKFALLFLDLDQFKNINDTLGHHIGDLLLKKVGKKLTECTRSTDIATRFDREESKSVIARLGGDEFIILLSDVKNLQNPAIVAKRILKMIPQTCLFEGNDISVTVSIGISLFPADGTKSATLLKNADSAMYHAKKKGRNNYQFYSEELNRAAREHFMLEMDLKKALKHKEFILYYQPQINQSNLIIDINKWVVQTAFKQSQEWVKAGLNCIRVAVNLSGYKFASQNIIQTIKTALQTVSLDANKFEVEITENILMQDNTETIKILEQIKELGINIALDDFGTGYSALKYLILFPVDTIKIDRSFVMGCTTQKHNRVIIRAIIAMGHSLGKKIIAEGIETEKQLELLKAFGCDEAQGYYFKPPLPEDEFANFLGKAVL